MNARIGLHAQASRPGPAHQTQTRARERHFAGFEAAVASNPESAQMRRGLSISEVG